MFYSTRFLTAQFKQEKPMFSSEFQPEVAVLEILLALILIKSFLKELKVWPKTFMGQQR